MARVIPVDACDGPYHGGGMIPPDDPAARRMPEQAEAGRCAKCSGPSWPKCLDRCPLAPAEALAWVDFPGNQVCGPSTLTTEHAESSDGQPVLLMHGQVYRPGDYVALRGSTLIAGSDTLVPVRVSGLVRMVAVQCGCEGHPLVRRFLSEES